MQQKIIPENGRRIDVDERELRALEKEKEWKIGEAREAKRRKEGERGWEWEWGRRRGRVKGEVVEGAGGHVEGYGWGGGGGLKWLRGGLVVSGGRE